MVQEALNSTILKMLNDKCPFEIFTGHWRYSPVCVIAIKDNNHTVINNMEKSRLESIIATIKMHRHL